MSSGSRIVAYYAAEESPGILPVSPIWKTLRRVTDGLNHRRWMNIDDVPWKEHLNPADNCTVEFLTSAFFEASVNPKL